MSLIDRVPIARRKMILFFLIDTSGSMSGKKIQSVNDAIENVLPIIGEISDENPDAEINIAAMKFSTGVDWVYNEPKEAKDFIWQPVSPEALTSLGEACRELSRKLSRTNGFMPTSTGSGYYAPAIILLSDGGPTDDFQGGLKVLKENSWFKNAIKVAIAIGDDAHCGEHLLHLVDFDVFFLLWLQCAIHESQCCSNHNNHYGRIKYGVSVALFVHNCSSLLGFRAVETTFDVCAHHAVVDEWSKCVHQQHC